MSTLSDRIRKRRIALGITQAELAQSMGVIQKQISRYESGENVPYGENMVRLAKALETSIDYLHDLQPEVTQNALSGMEIRLVRAYRRKNMRALLELIMPLACNGDDTDE